MTPNTPRVYRSTSPDIDLYKGSCLSYLFSNPLNTPSDKKVLINSVTREFRTYGDVQKRTKSLVQGFRQIVRPSSVVVFISPNTIDYTITCYAVIGCGAILSPANAACTSLELAAQLQTSGAQILIAHSSLKRLAEEAIKIAPSVQRLVIADGREHVDGNVTAEMLMTACPPGDLHVLSLPETEQSLALLCFSSGTTGQAKGVRTSHLNITANMQQWAAHLPGDWDGRSVSVGFLPLSHIYGMMYYAFMCMLYGNPVVLMPKFDLDQYLGLVQSYQVRSLVLVPPVILMIARDPRVAKYNLTCVERVMSAAAPLSSELRRQFEQRLQKLFGTSVFTYQCWGMTETSPLMTGTKEGSFDKLDTVGSLVPNAMARLVDPETLLDIEVGKNGSTTMPGEVWVRGPNVFSGYYGNAKGTADCFVQDEQGRDWYRSGDIAVVDSEGYFTIVDRIKEMIKYKGLQVVPSELEAKLMGHPAVLDACVIGKWYEEEATELPLAFVVLSAEAKSLSHDPKGLKEQIGKYIQDRVAWHKHLRGGIIFIEQIPKSPTGKVLRRQLKADLQRQREPLEKL